MRFNPRFLFLLESLALFSCDSSSKVDEADGGASCTESQKRCNPAGLPEICTEGTWRAKGACKPGEQCKDGECLAPICKPGESRCAGSKLLEQCSDDGLSYDQIPCADRCSNAGSIAICGDLTCIPGERTCNGTELIVQCSEDGSHFEYVGRCNGQQTGQECDRGECVPLCIINEKLRTNVGCDYWAVDLDNALVPGGSGYLDAAGAPFAVVVSNPHSSFTAEISVLNSEGLVVTALVPPLGLRIFNLPRRDAEGTVKAALAYRLRSSIPIVAYQFNPLDNEDVFSNDASLLLPSHVVGSSYRVMTREQSFENLRGFLTVVGISEEPTQVEVTVTAQTMPGQGIPALAPGESYKTVLHQYELLNIETNAPGADLTGSLIEASQNVAVFGGSEAANAPNTNHCIDIDEETETGICEYDGSTPCRNNYDCDLFITCCADHIEQQLYPIDTWGRHYIATKSYDRGLEDDYWRIMAAEDGTKIETVPPQAAIPILNAGESFEFGSREHFEILSDKPILVGQFLASEQAPNPNLRDKIEPGDAGTGDPAFILAVPVEQFRKDFVFLAPDKYAFDYVNIIAPATATIVFDEARFPDVWEPIGDGREWKTARWAISDGTHFIEADEPIAVIVYGYDQYVSYGYPGGLNLDIVDPATTPTK